MELGVPLNSESQTPRVARRVEQRHASPTLCGPICVHVGWRLELGEACPAGVPPRATGAGYASAPSGAGVEGRAGEVGSLQGSQPR